MRSRSERTLVPPADQEGAAGAQPATTRAHPPQTHDTHINITHINITRITCTQVSTHSLHTRLNTRTRHTTHNTPTTCVGQRGRDRGRDGPAQDKHRHSRRAVDANTRGFWTKGS